MRKFKSLETGAIIVPNSEIAIKQFENSKYYEEIKDNSKDKSKGKSKDNSKDKSEETTTDDKTK